MGMYFVIFAAGMSREPGKVRCAYAEGKGRRSCGVMSCGIGSGREG